MGVAACHVRWHTAKPNQSRCNATPPLHPQVFYKSNTNMLLGDAKVGQGAAGPAGRHVVHRRRPLRRGSLRLCCARARPAADRLNSCVVSTLCCFTLHLPCRTCARSCGPACMSSLAWLEARVAPAVPGPPGGTARPPPPGAHPRTRMNSAPL